MGQITNQAVTYIYTSFISVANHLSVINKLSSQQLLAREQFHVNAVKAYASGDLPEACVQLEKCVVEYPRGNY